MHIYINLSTTYYNQPFFNISTPYNHLFAGHEEQIKIQLGLNGEMILGKINRTANNNGTPRIMSGGSCMGWIQANYNLGDQMKFEVIMPNSIIIYGKGGTSK